MSRKQYGKDYKTFYQFLKLVMRYANCPGADFANDTIEIVRSFTGRNPSLRYKDYGCPPYRSNDKKKWIEYLEKFGGWDSWFGEAFEEAWESYEYNIQFNLGKFK